jgi:hypothetical protein
MSNPVGTFLNSVLATEASTTKDTKSTKEEKIISKFDWHFSYPFCVYFVRFVVSKK